MVTDTRGPRNWSGIATAYADSFAHLCAGTIPDLVAHALLDADPSVLEVGAGSGLLSARLAGAGARLTSLDPDPDMLRLLRSVVPA
ncbi:MAG: class I SAM-dependent methyltransferase, partial [Nocardioides sp.]|nr:class I SAM-dependent methyltransferase [Nocardioides sp.]